MYGKYATEGTAYLTFEWAIRGKWSNGVNDGANPNIISLDWENDKNWSISGTRTAKGGSIGAWRMFENFIKTSKSSYVPPNILTTNVPVPKVEIPVWNSLDYFLTTNLLYPGKQMFKAHEIGKQDSKSLALPFDLILTDDLNMTAQ
ncbi:hypothetical protein N7478_004365 [Penicillium angulare]|uniref:uncharacterized protein n=1 Tax=Penicillium angulare TaxID=116970 RepID=UPI00253FB2BA|nr:uncharacterized protein N7478_004365 [Penicillium angulare]KAJ5278993.1 hypothetical protein N7478_004365 [Penicillium angulare]